jgi:hypothetical protein
MVTTITTMLLSSMETWKYLNSRVKASWWSQLCSNTTNTTWRTKRNSKIKNKQISSSSNSQMNLLIGRYAQEMTTAVARMYVWGKTCIRVVSFSFQEWDVQNRVSAKVSALGLALEKICKENRMCSNSFVMSNNYPSLEIMTNPHTATWQLLRSNSVMSTRLCAQTMLIVGSLSSVLR